MSNQKPSVGRIVLYTPSNNEKKALEALGNNPADKMPAVIVAVHTEHVVALKVMVNGNHPDLWKPSCQKESFEGMVLCWDWPKRS